MYRAANPIAHFEGRGSLSSFGTNANDGACEVAADEGAWGGKICGHLVVGRIQGYRGGLHEYLIWRYGRH